MDAADACISRRKMMSVSPPLCGRRPGAEVRRSCKKISGFRASAEFPLTAPVALSISTLPGAGLSLATLAGCFSLIVADICAASTSGLLIRPDDVSIPVHSS